jgi:hypothetical protein
LSGVNDGPFPSRKPELLDPSNQPMAASILQYLPRLLPELQVSPLPEVIFLSTIKVLVVSATSLSLSQWCTVTPLILLTNTSPELRKVTLKLYRYLSFIIGAEIALINAYVLVRLTLLALHPHSLTLSEKVCSWISPETTLHPLTVAILNVLNSVIPVFTDSVILLHLMKERAFQSDSKVTLVTTIGAPILLKFARLASAIMYIQASAEFIIASFTTANDRIGIAADFAAMEMTRTQNVYISSSLQVVDNLSAFTTVFYVTLLRVFFLQVFTQSALDSYR